MKLSIAAKFNLVFVSIFAVGFLAAGVVADRLLKESAREETLQNARLLLEAAKSVRGYTASQIQPLLKNQMKFEFHPQSVPSYSAVENLNVILKSYPDFSYKEATLNPTNPRDRATDWEADVINQFRLSPTTVEATGERDTPTGRTLFLARPIQIKSQACLECHSTVDVAPKTMLDLYGNANGFGWKLNDVIGMQVVSVPTAVPIARANGAFRTFMIMLGLIFLLMIALLNAMLYLIVVKRVTRLSQVADQVSLGNMGAGEFRSKSKDEIGVLTDALGRMKTSVVQAMSMLEDK